MAKLTLNVHKRSDETRSHTESQQSSSITIGCLLVLLLVLFYLFIRSFWVYWRGRVVGRAQAIQEMHAVTRDPLVHAFRKAIASLRSRPTTPIPQIFVDGDSAYEFPPPYSDTIPRRIRRSIRALQWWIGTFSAILPSHNHNNHEAPPPSYLHVILVDPVRSTLERVWDAALFRTLAVGSFLFGKSMASDTGSVPDRVITRQPSNPSAQESHPVAQSGEPLDAEEERDITDMRVESIA